MLDKDIESVRKSIVRPIDREDVLEVLISMDDIVQQPVFSPLCPQKGKDESIAKVDHSIALGGHRGMGANVWTSQGPPLVRHRYRENTVSSFVAAAAAGATFVEFDVQVTSDDVPVLFHDNFLVYGDLENPSSVQLKDLPLAHFKGAAPINSSSDVASLAGMSDDEVTSTTPWPMLSMSSTSDENNHFLAGGSPLWGGGSSLGGDSPRWGMLMRTKDAGMPAAPMERSLSAWEVEEEDEFPTLLEVFEKVPPKLAFDIEIKMVTPDDMERTPAEEIERVVGSILRAIESIEDQVLSEGRPHRDLVFSSFDPDVCLEVKSRRPQHDVMFLSGGGRDPHADPRRSSVQAAIDFAASNNLQGIILDSGALFDDQDAVKRANEVGLKVMTYGIENDDPEWVAKQEELKVHGAIVDDVSGISTYFQNL